MLYKDSIKNPVPKRMLNIDKTYIRMYIDKTPLKIEENNNY